MPPSRNMSWSLVSADALLGHHQQARGLAVEPMGQFEEFRQRPRPAQLLDHAEGHPAAAMHRDTGGLVDHDQRLILMGNFKFPCRNNGLRRTFGGADGRHAQAVADLQPILGRHPALVHPHLAAAQDAVDMALGHTLGNAQQEVVDALAFGFLADFKPCHRIFA